MLPSVSNIGLVASLANISRLVACLSLVSLQLFIGDNMHLVPASAAAVRHCYDCDNHVKIEQHCHTKDFSRSLAMLAPVALRVDDVGQPYRLTFEYS